MISRFTKFMCFLVMTITLFVSCNEQKGNSTSTLFTRIYSDESGITFNNKIIDEKDHNILKYANYYGGAGIGIGDFNNDGLADIYFAGNLVDDKLYINQGDFKFQDVTQNAGIIKDGSWSTGVTVADVNNDGLLDIYVTKELYDDLPEARKNHLYINQGNASFKEMAESYGVASQERTRHATFLDYNKDGFLDLFILNQPPNPGSYSEFFGTELLQPEYTSRLYRNEGGKSFVDITENAGVFKTGFPNAVSASDLNNDGWTDLYVANDFYAPDFMYMNNQDGTFTNIANEALQHMSFYSMGVDIADINNDNYLDIFVLDMTAEDNFRLKSNMSGMNPSAFWKVVNDGGHYQYMFNTLQVNNGNNTYSEIAQLTDMAATDWSWANLVADFDNDGNKDIYVTNGLLRDIRNTDASKAVGDFVIQTADNWVKENPNGGDISIWEILDLEKTLDLLPSVPLSNYMFQNNGDYQFSKVAEEWGLAEKSFSNGSAYADLDNDGDLDLVTNNMNDEAFLYRNNSTRNFLRLSLKSKNNKPVFGARIALSNNGSKQVVETTNVRGIYSTSESVVHFGLGDDTVVDRIRIDWPNNTSTVLQDINVNQLIEVYLEDAENTIEVPEKKSGELLFSDVTSENNLVYKHQENAFNDYKHQVLLPHKLSQFGPSLATADVNADGLEDVFVGGAVGFPAQLFIQQPNGEFRTTEIPIFGEDRLAEDVDAVFFDLENDGDQDLYVVSGGNEFEPENSNYMDRLYLNDGNGGFTKSNDLLSISGFSGSVVVPADFDSDGDLDLFIGGRMIPRDYPMPADSKILENVNGKMIDITNSKAAALQEIGMVTDAVWSDFDNDNDLDLIVVGEWMPITVLENNSGSFSTTAIPSLANTSGWWFSINQGDFDGDGDMDYLVGNLGLNYKYKTSEGAPFDVYYKDLDNSGTNDIVLGYYNHGQHFPLRGFSCSAEQIPALKDEVKKYDAFAALNLEDIYGEENLENALHYETDTFASSFLENLGDGAFKISQLPIEAQFSSINDIVIDDFNADDHLDALVAGNLFVSEIETTRNDAGVGLLLLGDGKNSFEALSHQDSGFFARRDVKKLKLINGKNEEFILVANNNDYLQVFQRLK